MEPVNHLKIHNKTPMSIFPLKRVMVIGSSMEPTFHEGDFLLVNQWSYRFNSPKKGDCIVFHDLRDGKLLVKRISKIKADNLFVTGDNSYCSTDSVVFGPISSEEIIGKVWKRVGFK